MTYSEVLALADIALGGSKPATLETGAVIQVPLFINVGEEILVDTRNEIYLSRSAGNSF